MADFAWPEQGKMTVVGTSPNRIDGVEKATGAAKYSYDQTPAKLLLAKALGCPHGHCKIGAIDVEAAKKVPGVVAAEPMKKAGDEIRWEGDLLAVVAGESEGAVAEGLEAIKKTLKLEKLDVWVDDADLEGAEKAGATRDLAGRTQFEKEIAEGEEDAEIERLLKESDIVVEGDFGIHVITHMCLEPHGSTCEWNGDQLTAHLSTQNVSGTAPQYASLGVTADQVTVHCDFIGGGFGSKFAVDGWGVACAKISKDTGRPVQLMLTRDQELKNAGTRPSGFVRARVGADKKGVVKVWDSHHWGTSGISGGPIAEGVVPYVFNPPNARKKVTSINTNAAPQRAWRAPNHPQGCAVSQTVYDDVARVGGLDSYDVFLANLPSVSNGKADVYAAQMALAAEKIGWKDKWHLHGKGPEKDGKVYGLGMGLHTWGGGGHDSSCTVKIHPDGGVETFLGSQDIGTGTRTVIAMVIAETLGLPVEAVKVHIGSSKYPASGPSGGSTTVGGVSESNRRGATEALNQLLAKVAEELEADAGDLEAVGGKIQVKGGGKSVSWKEACGLLGMKSIEAAGTFQRATTYPADYKGPRLSGNQVAGVQMAEVSVDMETGVVTMENFVAVQDMGLIINRKTAESQIYGAVIMGIAFALFEERIMDNVTGEFLNAELGDYKLPRLGDVGKIMIELYEPASEYERGVIGLGEPPVISPGAAISNAVANALGVRVSPLPMTPKRVLDALAKA
jgi:xanthine dehydrogenase YagR molybdenum-binding subunit